MPDIERMADDVFAAVKGYVSAEVAKALAAIPAGKEGQPGIQGEKGIDGKDGRDGVDGKNGRDGVDGQKGVDGIDGQDGIDGKDGNNGNNGKDGEIGPMGERGEKGLDGEDGREGRDGKQGLDGRDALQIEPVMLDESKGYPRGTYAIHAGGTVFAVHPTIPLNEGKSLQESGWIVTQNGIADLRFSTEDDGRIGILLVKMTSGKHEHLEFKTAAMIFRGLWKAGTYDRGDRVTSGNQEWQCLVDGATDEPGTSKQWLLAVRKGRDGRDFAPAAKDREPIRLK